MEIGVIGTGYVGLVTGACLSNLGHKVYCMDTDHKKIDDLNSGKVPIYEPGLKEIIDKNVKQERLFFEKELDKIVKVSKAIFIAVGTPSAEDGSMDLSYVKGAARDIAVLMDSYKVIITKSTVPPGTGNLIKEIIKKEYDGDFDVVSNPEFLKEGSAIKDFMTPDRIIIGNGSKKSERIIREIYEPLTRTGKPLVITNPETAEMIKYAANAMLATRISFMNQLAAFCETVGADVKEVANGIGLDDRIGSRFLHAGIGYGGSCFPKDVKGLIKAAEKHGHDLKILKEVENANQQQKTYLIPKIEKELGDLKGKTIVIWGLAFKPKTDDMREAPSISMIKKLQELGVKIKAYDPEATENAKKIFKEIEYGNNPLEILNEADALVVATEWDEFRSIDKIEIRKRMKGKNIFDGRNIYEPEEMRKHGFNYHCVGRK